MSKLKKFFKTPGMFFRDFFINRYPIDYKNGVLKLKIEGGKKTISLNNFEKIDIDLGYELVDPIDIVITWVDGCDEEFLRQKIWFEKQLSDKFFVKPEITDMARYESKDELRYTLRSIEKYAPWVNRVYLVTNGTLPQWLNKSAPKLTTVSHHEIIEKKYLPTFNSHVIESHLHKIPNLSEFYLYFNDDVMLARPVSPKYFFTAGGLVKLFVTNSRLPNSKISLYDTPTQWAAKNSRDMIYKHFGHFPNAMFAHTFHPQLRSLNEAIEQRWSDVFNSFRLNRFRSDNDLAVATFLHHHYAILSGKAIAKKTSCMYFNVRSIASKQIYKTLLARKGKSAAPYSMCLNDTISTSSSGDFDYQFEMTDFLEKYFPTPSVFENVDVTNE